MNAVIYARYSSHSQNEQSIEGQLKDDYAYADQLGIKVVGEYIDKAQSGRTDARTDFQRMMEDAPKGHFKMVIVWKLDRFARNRYDSAIYKAKLKKHGIRVVSVKENITDSPEGIILEGLLESMAEYYSANLAQNIRRGQRDNVAKGIFCGGQVPYGYKVVDGKLVADEKTAPVVRYVFEQYASGAAMKDIIAELNNRGVRSARGGKLTRSSFTKVLTNTVYIGQYKYNGDVVPGLAEPIVDKDVFDKAQLIVKANAKAPATGKALVEYVLHGKAFCGYCGKMMIGESGYGRHGTRYNYYTCGSRKRKEGCKKKNEKKDQLEWYVVEQTLSYVLEPERMRYIARSVVEQYEKEFDNGKIAEMEKTVSQLDYELNKLVDALIDAPKVAHTRIYEKMQSIESQKSAAEEDLIKLKIASDIRYTEAEICAWLKNYCTGDTFDPDFRRNIIDTFINSIYLFDNRIVIFYNIKGGKQVSYTDLNSALSTIADHPADSDMAENAPPFSSVFEPHFIMINGVFGFVFRRNEE